MRVLIKARTLPSFSLILLIQRLLVQIRHLIILTCLILTLSFFSLSALFF